ncbi:tetratricopeptide repeat protein [Methylobacillus gramineus]|uniref:tetratricopeptide repeat protein n=1 Tax=Methylobacillus gramineus TaxID=755169 RepID=UPI001CFF69AD|nr:tetratricopeptide repeat protein [Methylobacillus gramineus]MCB5185470.1 tetratricopeptide repeat protein [Methylobacillus gramineus]
MQKRSSGTPSSLISGLMNKQGLSNQPSVSVQNLLQQAISLQRDQQLEEAIKLYRQILQQQAGHYQVWTLLSTAYLALNDYAQALECIGHTLELNPGQFDAYNIAGDALFLTGHYEEAAKAYSESLVRNPSQASTYVDMGNAMSRLGDTNTAEQCYRKALTVDAHHVAAHNNLGLILQERSLFEQALECFKRALAMDPGNADALLNAGSVLKELQQYDQSLQYYDRLLRLLPDHVSAYNNRGLVLHAMGHYDEALENYSQAIALDHQHANAYLNRAITLTVCGRYEEARQDNDQAIALASNKTRAYNNRGSLHQELGMLDEALEDYRQAQLQDADNAIAQWNEAIIHLVRGNWAKGWPLFEARWAALPTAQGLRRVYAQPLWLGDAPLQGKRILLYPEQGLGDVIQFARYASLVKALGAHVILEVPSSLLSIMASLDQDIQLIASGDTVAFDYQCPLMSLPLAFKTTQETVPAQSAYLFSDEARLPAFNLTEPHGRRVGLVWSGAASHARDHKRSIPLEQLASWLNLPLDFHSLQQEVRPHDARSLANLPQLTTHQPALQDFADTAALISAMDLVISVDTSVAHMAAALGKPVWLLVSYMPDYRWMLDRSDSPWYPSVRIFRQPTLGDWDSVIAQVKAELEVWASQQR